MDKNTFHVDKTPTDISDAAQLVGDILGKLGIGEDRLGSFIDFLRTVHNGDLPYNTESFNILITCLRATSSYQRAIEILTEFVLSYKNVFGGSGTDTQILRTKLSKDSIDLGIVSSCVNRTLSLGESPQMRCLLDAISSYELLGLCTTTRDTKERILRILRLMGVLNPGDQRLEDHSMYMLFIGLFLDRVRKQRK